MGIDPVSSENAGEDPAWCVCEEAGWRDGIEEKKRTPMINFQ